MSPVRYCVRDLRGAYLTGNLNLFREQPDIFYSPEAGIAYTYATREDAERMAVRHGGIAATFAPEADAPPAPRYEQPQTLDLFA